VKFSHLSIAPTAAEDLLSINFSSDSRYLSFSARGFGGMVDMPSATLVASRKVPGAGADATLPLLSGTGSIMGKHGYFPLPKGKRVAFKAKLKKGVNHLGINAAQTHVVSSEGFCTQGCRVRLHEIATGATVAQFTERGAHPFRYCVFDSPDTITALDAVYTVRRWNIKSGQLLHRQTIESTPLPEYSWIGGGNYGMLSADGRLALNLLDGLVLWNTSDGSVVFSHPGALDVLMDDKADRLVTSVNYGSEYDQDRRLTLIDRKKNTDEPIPKEFYSNRLLTLSPNGRYMVTAGWESAGSDLYIIDFDV